MDKISLSNLTKGVSKEAKISPSLTNEELTFLVKFRELKPKRQKVLQELVAAFANPNSDAKPEES